MRTAADDLIEQFWEKGRKESVEVAERIAQAGILSLEQARAMLGLDNQGPKQCDKKGENHNR